MIRRYRMRTGVALICLALAALGLFGEVFGRFSACALGEGERELLSIQMSAQPEEMVEPGDVTLNFTVENISNIDAQSVYLSSADGLLSEPMGQIAAGETQMFNRTHSVTADELEAGEITYTISHDDPTVTGGKVNYTVRAEIRRSDVRPQAEFTRQFSSRCAAAGSALTITYRVRNTGNVALIDLRVQDALGDFTGRIDRLDVGESRTLVSRATVTEETVSSASLSYDSEGSGDESFVLTLEDVPIHLAQAGLEHSFSAAYSSSTQNAANVVLTLQNTGNVDYLNLCVTDALHGGVIADGLTVPAGGAPVEVRRACAIRGSDGLCWRVTGVSAAGDALDFTTETLNLVPVTGEAAALSVSATALTPRIRRSGNVDVRVRIVNSGGADVRNISLSEAVAGELCTFAILPAGGSIERDFPFHVTEDSSYCFSISYLNADVEVQSVTSSPAEIAIASDGVLPEGASARLFDFSGNSIKIGGSSTFAVLLIAGCVVLLALLVMLLIASRRARLEKRLRIAAERQRRKEEMGKTNRFTPVRAPQKNKGKGRNSQRV